MMTKKLICLLLALVLAAMCFAGCRSKKEEKPLENDSATQQTEPEAAAPEQTEEPQQVEVIDNLTDSSGGLELNEDEFVIDVPEGMEIGGD